MHIKKSLFLLFTVTVAAVLAAPAPVDVNEIQNIIKREENGGGGGGGRGGDDNKWHGGDNNGGDGDDSHRYCKWRREREIKNILWKLEFCSSFAITADKEK
ncbi:hypothetical protein HK100_005948 [Physocladia obscura]|uniref:Glycine-rich protein n=1 Tax=Physocladia obscura TaxID=109957 RepID=A0AAD5XCX6_9FUNG|nr:hypothetical protein HK100_005948 [Physocladia obscura]